MYTDFAYAYDKLMYDVDYKVWADYIEKIYQKFGLAPSLIADLGCGTGSFCIEMADRGYDMIGVDVSPDMLSCAGDKSRSKGLDILLLNQDMSEFELFGTVDSIVCLVDSLNYLTKKSNILKMFKLVENYLNPGGLFIFDINTEFKLEKTLGNNVFYEVGDDISYIWQCSFNKKERKSNFDITFFIKERELYHRYDEVHTEKAYGQEEIKHLVEQAGLQLLDIFDELSFNPARETSERVFFVCRKNS
ncbi:MAG: class I SAM-dependent methyltransferase [Bacillota bacterium]|nr:class I SAM-dependent methyltransferase [Bacillota bacterium]